MKRLLSCASFGLLIAAGCSPDAAPDDEGLASAPMNDTSASGDDVGLATEDVEASAAVNDIGEWPDNTM